MRCLGVVEQATVETSEQTTPTHFSCMSDGNDGMLAVGGDDDDDDDDGRWDEPPQRTVACR